MEVKIFPEWLREQWADDAMPEGVPTRPVRVPQSSDMDNPQEFRQFLVEYHLDIRPGCELLPKGAMFSVGLSVNHNRCFNPPSKDETRLTFCKLFYQIKLSAVHVYLKDLTDAMMGVSEQTIQGERRQWAEPFYFKWSELELGKPPQAVDYNGDKCAIAAKKRLKHILKVYKNKRDKLQREIAKLPHVIVQEDSARINERIVREAREAALNYKAQFTKA